ncbi:MAG: hypothetical protein B7Y80_18665 [Hyphomicrobium sp. 32-62-53]|nr:MAG: hypothetical protein B7Z29_19750 [Hyphomicrobium sp. 12-62-95]OYX97767.1 MAG: hypothetical protein B7Y80_18665 [Hyphomicrobium sp. 32-62-53]
MAATAQSAKVQAPASEGHHEALTIFVAGARDLAVDAKASASDRSHRFRYRLSAKFGTHAGLSVIFVTSIIFYIPWGALPFVLLIASVLVNFSIGATLLLMRPERARERILILAAGQLYNFASLFWFKYKYLLDIFSASAAPELTAENIAIPAGISFYTFHQAAFLADAYSREEHTKQTFQHLRSTFDVAKSFLKYATFVIFFPQLVIGPITYFREYAPQIAQKKFGKFYAVNIEVGLSLIAIGLFKKIVLADNLAPASDVAFAAAGDGLPINTWLVWIGVFSFYCQLYFDFSGYSDMALGLARLFGLVYPINFYSPLKAVGIIDFYRRWHMTLTRVVSRFIFTPLSLAGMRLGLAWSCSKLQTRILAIWIPLLVNFELIGLWHGGLATFALFGIVHGLWYIVETEVRASAAFKSWKKQTSHTLRRWLGRAIFLLPMVLCFALFRSENVTAYWHLLTQLAGASDVPPAIGLRYPSAILAAAMMIIYALPNSAELLSRYRPGIRCYDNESYGARWPLRWRPTLPWAILLLSSTLMCLYYVSRQPPFLYQGF